MNVQNIDTMLLDVSDLNVRKRMTQSDGEADLTDLSEDIKVNGLLNPLTVRLQGSRYEVIAGQRRLLAMRMLDWPTMPCNIIVADAQKSEELSLVENVQRNEMSSADKVGAYTRLYNVYDQDITRVVAAVHMTRVTIQKYITISGLPESVIDRLDQTGDTRITIDVAVELSKIKDKSVDIENLCHSLQALKSTDKIVAIKRFIESDYTYSIEAISGDIMLEKSNVILAPSYPYVPDRDGNYIRIPEALYADVLALIRNN
jgi:ParB/RepB/Spo0J family partition protein